MAKTKGSSVNKTRAFGGVEVRISLGNSALLGPGFRAVPADGLAGMRHADRELLVDWAWGEWNGWDCLPPTATKNTVRSIFFGDAK
jgi:hypothetical protein